MTTLLRPTLDDTLCGSSRVARQRIGETHFVASMVRGELPYESYATMVRSVGGIVQHLESALMLHPALATFSRSGLGLRHAFTRDIAVSSGFARVRPVAERVWLGRLEGLAPELLVAHLALFHLDCPLGGRPAVEGLAKSTGLSASRGLEALALSGKPPGAAKDRWSVASSSLGADGPGLAALIAEANVAAALLEHLLNEVHSADTALPST